MALVIIILAAGFSWFGFCVWKAIQAYLEPSGH